MLNLLLKTGHFLRTLIYIWATVELLITTFLYYEANRRMKSKVIETLVNFLTVLSILVGFLTLVPIILILKQELFEYMSILIIFPLLGIAVYARKFREESLKSDGKKIETKIVSKE